jgi:ketosteroid isomerase-like protein
MTLSPLETVTRMLDAVRDRQAETVLDCFDPGADTYVFLEGPRWTNRGGQRIRQGWRAYFQAPIRLRSWAWTEGPDTHESGDLALVLGVISYAFEAAGERRPLLMRMTWALRRGDGVWRILHEHGSQPLADPYGTGDWLTTADQGQGPTSTTSSGAGS